jgi:hypothetical protein
MVKQLESGLRDYVCLECRIFKAEVSFGEKARQKLLLRVID